MKQAAQKRAEEAKFRAAKNTNAAEARAREAQNLERQAAEAQRAALSFIIEGGLTVAATDAYIEALLAEETLPDPPKGEAKRTFIMKDVRIFLNTLARSIEVMKQGGIDAGVRREETEDSLILTISIPKARQGTKN